MLLLEKLFLFTCCVGLKEVTTKVTSYATTFAYTGTTTSIDCPIQVAFRTVNWRGPPGNIPYYDPGTGVFNQALGEKINRLSFPANNSMLLSGTKLSDAGLYSCSTAVNSILYQGDNTVQVRTKADQPRITPLPDENNVLAIEGSSFTIQCISRGGNPAPTVVLYKGSINGQVLPGTSTVSPVGDIFTVTLSYTFTPTRADDRQQLVCRSYWPTTPNATDSQQTGVTFYLYLKPLQPTFPQPASVVTGKTVTATCITTGSRPAADISWLYRGQTFTPTATVIEDPSSETFTVVSVLQMPVTATDNGQALQCRVTNRALTSPLTESRTLNVQFPVERSSTSITGNNQIEANGINHLHLTCITGLSNPASDITWRNGNDIISNNNGYSETSGANNGFVRSQILTLQPTRHDDGDTIYCVVSNGVQQVTDTTSIVLDLRYSPVIADMSHMDVTEGDQITLKCNASSKPVASFTWKKDSTTVTQGTGTASYNGYDYMMPAVNRAQAGTYTCTAVNQISPPDSKQTSLTVLYPPDIVVAAVNTTVISPSTTVTCDPSGVPDQYTYERWVHTWHGHTVTHQVPLPDTKVLTLIDLSYAHSGEYTCGASNGVKGVSQGSGNLIVKSFPVIVGDAAKTKEIKANGQLKQPIAATFQYYSNAGSGFVKVYRTSGTLQEVGGVNYRNVSVSLPVFLSEIDTPVTEVSISIIVEEESQFGTYEVHVTNEIDTVRLALVILPRAECTSVDCQTSQAVVIGSVFGGALGGFILCVLLHQIVLRMSGRRITKYKPDDQAKDGVKEYRQNEIRVQSTELNIEVPASSYEMLGSDQSAHPYSDLTPASEGQSNTYEMLSGEAQSTHLYTDLKSTQEGPTPMHSDGKLYINLSLK